MTNIAKSSDLWKGDSITTYDVLDLQEIIDSNIPIVSVQKWVVEKGLTRILEWMWIENLWKDTLENSMWRSWFMSIDSREYWEIGILWTKWADSTQSFAQISDYYLWWTDIWDKVQARGLGLEEKERVLWEIIWWCKTELLLLLWENFINTSLMECRKTWHYGKQN